MSPDNIFASQMWSWPDPMIKRDESGRILFLNAAFLGLYGGRVEDWQGSTVMGWPAPHMGPTPNRFETRLPTENGEFVFDWLEFSSGSGQVLAIARDVTAFIQAVGPAPVVDQQVVQHQHDTAQQPVQPNEVQLAWEQSAPAQIVEDIIHTPEPHLPPLQASAVEPIAAQAVAPVQSNVPMQTVHAQAPQVEVQQAQTQQVQAPQTNVPQAQPPQVEVPQVQAPMAAAPANQMPPPAAPAQIMPVVVAAAPEIDEQRERAFQKRPLPIENQDAVLGTNWRDAVIARAVSSEDAEAEVALTPTPEAPAPTNSETSVPSSAQRILLAEDNAINALLTRTLLEAEGCIVDVVEDGALAVEAVKNATYDMIFMDMRMPNMDGLEATRKIRAQAHTSNNLPIIALTANAFDDDRNACFDSGMNDFMTKPVSAEELSAMVSSWTAKKEAA